MTEPGLKLRLYSWEEASPLARISCVNLCMCVRTMLTLYSLQVLAEVLTGIPAMDNSRNPVYLVREPTPSGSQLWEVEGWGGQEPPLYPSVPIFIANEA